MKIKKKLKSNYKLIIKLEINWMTKIDYKLEKKIH